MYLTLLQRLHSQRLSFLVRSPLKVINVLENKTVWPLFLDRVQLFSLDRYFCREQQKLYQVFEKLEIYTQVFSFWWKFSCWAEFRSWFILKDVFGNYIICDFLINIYNEISKDCLESWKKYKNTQISFSCQISLHIPKI